MVWKRIKSGWPSALVELVLVTAGVFFALAVDGWNDSRLDRIEEAGYLQRLIVELEEDTASFRFVLGAIDSKEQALLRLRALLESSDPVPADSSRFLADLGQSANFGWNVGPLTQSASFEDLRSSGKLGLIRDPSLRLEMVEYYATAEGEDRRMEARKTDFPRIAYRLVPRHQEYAPELEPGLSEGGVRRLLAQVRESELSGQIVAELNRARFIRASINDLKIQAEALLGKLQEYAVGE